MIKTLLKKQKYNRLLMDREVKMCTGVAWYQQHTFFYCIYYLNYTLFLEKYQPYSEVENVEILDVF